MAPGITFTLGMATLSILMLAAPARAQEYMLPDKPPPEDHQVQGEYVGTTTDGTTKLGAWVVGQGGNNYLVSFLKGGLLDIPGATGGGWDRTVKWSGTGQAANLTTPHGFKAAISGTGENRVMTGTTHEGKAFTLNRVLRKGPTQGLVPKTEWKAEHWFRQNTAADLANWVANPAQPQMKYGGNLYRGVRCTKTHGTVFLHIEVRSPYCPSLRDQSRGNSGIYLRSMHEMQVLESFGFSGAQNELGGIYGVKAPIINAALPPLTWQTYDCYYKVEPGANTATFTVYLNGVLVQNKTMVTGITQAGFAGNSLYLQDHGNDVVYSNIWAVQNATEETLPYASVMGSVVGLGENDGIRLGDPVSKARWTANPTGTSWDILGRSANLPHGKVLRIRLPE